jgi:EAL domain-containing protein (putative c-di-GMP-specific phosphodiesterase class I)
MLHGVPDDPRAVGLLTATLNVLDRLGVEAVAVGVETEAQLDWLIASGCQLAQGHRLGRPVQIDTFYRVHVESAG